MIHTNSEDILYPKEVDMNKKKCFFIFILCVFLVCMNIVSAEERILYPIGKTVGITAGFKGVWVVSITEFETETGDVISPAGIAGIMADDIIFSIDGDEIYSVDELESKIQESDGSEIKVGILRGNEKKESVLIPQKNKSDGKYKLGVWIKDSTSGIGTLTYYDPSTKSFGALGHGICDETNSLIDINKGYIYDASVNSVRRGEKGIPGELIAVFEDDENILGEIMVNSGCGVFGITKDEIIAKDALPVVERESVCEGEASILSNIEGDAVCEYSAEIVKINRDETNSRCLIIKITDPRLLEKTGGIVRGMSGSPILQDGKLVGAVTHVFVNDPTRGYGIFIENMLAESEKIK